MTGYGLQWPTIPPHLAPVMARVKTRFVAALSADMLAFANDSRLPVDTKQLTYIEIKALHMLEGDTAAAAEADRHALGEFLEQAEPRWLAQAYAIMAQDFEERRCVSRHTGKPLQMTSDHVAGWRAVADALAQFL